jgi:hypothetical protein
MVHASRAVSCSGPSETQAVCKSRDVERLSVGEAESITNALVREARRVKFSLPAAARPSFDFDGSPLAAPQCAAARTSVNNSAGCDGWPVSAAPQ